MNPEQRQVYNHKLEAVLLEIEDYLSKSEDAAEAVSPDKSLGRLSRMEAMQDQQFVLEVRRRQKRRSLEVGDGLCTLGQRQAIGLITYFPFSRFSFHSSGLACFPQKN